MAKTYKVLTERDRLIGKFDPAKLERALNQHAADGWQLTAVATADVRTAFGKDKQEALFILERDA